MRKKSHIVLAGQMMESLELQGVMKHRVTFYLGNVLPDCRPSFLTTPHTFDDTFRGVGRMLYELVDTFDASKGMTISKTARLGELTHYVADYFTFPHNSHYDGNLKDHCVYEGDLKRNLKWYVNSGQAMVLKDRIEVFGTVEELLSYIGERHAQYMSKKRCIVEDMEFIITVCTSVLASVLSMCLKVAGDLLVRPGYGLA